MPLFLVKHLVITLNPNSSKGNATKKVPNLSLFDKLLRNFFSPKESTFPMITIIVANSNPTKFMHNAGGPPPNPPRLNAIPKLVLD